MNPRERSSHRAQRNRPRNRARDLIGRDVSHLRFTDARRAWLLLLAVAVPTALAVAGLRVDVIRLRYALAETEAMERSLIERRRALVADARALRNPERLASEAERLGFGAPAALLRLGRPALRPKTRQHPGARTTAEASPLAFAAAEAASLR